MGELWYVIAILAILAATVIFLLGVPLIFELYIETRCRKADEGRLILGNEGELKQRYLVVQNNGLPLLAMVCTIYKMFFYDIWFRLDRGWWRLVCWALPEYVHGREIKIKLRQHKKFLLHEYDIALEQREQVRARIRKVHSDWAEAMSSAMEVSQDYSTVASVQDNYESVLESGWNRLMERPPNGFRTIAVEDNALIFYFERRGEDREGRRNRRNNNNLVAVTIGLENGEVSGLNNPWTPEVRIAAIKYLAQGNLSALATMIARSVMQMQER